MKCQAVMAATSIQDLAHGEEQPDCRVFFFYSKILVLLMLAKSTWLQCCEKGTGDGLWCSSHSCFSLEGRKEGKHMSYRCSGPLVAPSVKQTAVKKDGYDKTF